MGRKLEKRIEDLEATVQQLRGGSAHQVPVGEPAPDQVVIDRVVALESELKKTEATLNDIMKNLAKEIALLKNTGSESAEEKFDPQVEERVKSAEILLQDIDSRVKVIKADVGSVKGRLTKLEKKK